MSYGDDREILPPVRPTVPLSPERLDWRSGSNPFMSLFMSLITNHYPPPSPLLAPRITILINYIYNIVNNTVNNLHQQSSRYDIPSFFFKLNVSWSVHRMRVFFHETSYQNIHASVDVSTTCRVDLKPPRWTIPSKT